MFCNNLTSVKLFFIPPFDQILPKKDEFKTQFPLGRRFRIPASGS